jgi:hypothetical protein
MSVPNQGTMTRGSGNAAPGRAGRSYNTPSRGSEGRGGAQSSPSRSYYSPPATRDSGGYGRSYAAPSSPSRSYNNIGGSERSYAAPSAPQRSFGSSVIRGGGGVTRPSSFRSMGWRGRM